MNVALRKPMTLEAFLAWEERQELRYEFDGFQPVAMTGGTFDACGDPAQPDHGPWKSPPRQTVPGTMAAS